MSADTVDDLYAAEDEVGRLRHVLNRIHAAMSWPFEWSADTPEAVAAILLAEGYRWPDEDTFNDEPTDADLAPFRPNRKEADCRPTCSAQIMQDEECLEGEFCGCPCHEGQEWDDDTGQWEDD